jgi:hypothetical protein
MQTEGVEADSEERGDERSSVSTSAQTEGEKEPWSAHAPRIHRREELDEEIKREIGASFHVGDCCGGGSETGVGATLLTCGVEGCRKMLTVKWGLPYAKSLRSWRQEDQM